MSEKSAAKALKEKLFYKKVNGRQGADETLLKSVDEYCEGYKKFLDASKPSVRPQRMLSKWLKSVDLPRLSRVKSIMQEIRFM